MIEMEAVDVQRNLHRILRMIERRRVKIFVTRDGQPTCWMLPPSDSETRHMELVRMVRRRP
jgi:hypothetical protein